MNILIFEWFWSYIHNHFNVYNIVSSHYASCILSYVVYQTLSLMLKQWAMWIVDEAGGNSIECSWPLCIYSMIKKKTLNVE